MSRIARLIRLEPMEAAEGEPPTGFASLQLVSAPGYREAYRLLMLLQMGLPLEGDLLQLSVKDLEVLYEYWTYLTVVRIVQEEHGPPERLDQMFRLNRSGLSIQLRRGNSQRVSFRAGSHRVVHVAYNPQFATQDATLIPQKPDILIRLEEDGWPVIQLVADAKYRVDTSEEYRSQFRSFGPPKDAINVLHRYRDAILELDQAESGPEQFKRSVVQAAALFPLSRQPGEDFRKSRLWLSLEKLGVGAIPLLPTNTVLLREWLLSALRQGGWSLADRAIANLAEERARDWRIAASESMLVGVLRSPGGRQHLEWIKRKRRYYHSLTKTQRRQFAVKQVAIYIPAGFNEPNGIRYVADVTDFEIVDRSEIETPWPPRRSEQMVLYHLGPLRALRDPIEFSPGDSMTPQGRWTTRLGLERARSVSEVALETEPEWRLLEWLRANRRKYTIRLDPPRVQDASNPKGRAWFHLATGDQIRFDGVNGFLWRTSQRNDRYISLSQYIDQQKE